MLGSAEALMMNAGCAAAYSKGSQSSEAKGLEQRGFKASLRDVLNWGNWALERQVFNQFKWSLVLRKPGARLRPRVNAQMVR